MHDIDAKIKNNVNPSNNIFLLMAATIYYHEQVWLIAVCLGILLLQINYFLNKFMQFLLTDFCESETFLKWIDYITYIITLLLQFVM